MAGKGKEELIGRAVIDVDFRNRLLADPRGTISAEGYVVDDALVKQIEGLDAAAAEAAARGLDGLTDRKAAS